MSSLGELENNTCVPCSPSSVTSLDSVESSAGTFLVSVDEDSPSLLIDRLTLRAAGSLGTFILGDSANYSLDGCLADMSESLEE